MFPRIFFVLAIPIVLGQNFTTCDPTTNSNCPPLPGFSSATTSFNFSSNYPKQDFTLFNPSANTITQDAGGLHITINALGEYPYIETNGIIIMSRSNFRLSVLWQGNGYHKINKRDNDRRLFQLSNGCQ